MPAVTDSKDGGPIPRRTRFAPAHTPWWRPRSTFGRVLLGTTAVLILGSLIALGILTRRFLIRDPHFRISGAASIQSSGLSEVNRSEVLPVFGEDIGRNIFFVPLAERRKQLEAIPWVRQATVMRYLPDHLSVSILERTPVAFVRDGQRVELADADGVILNMPPSMMVQHHYSFPVLTGINPQDSLAARRGRMALYLKFVSELDQGNQHQSEQVSEIDLSDPEDLRATMPEQGSDILAHFGQDQFLRRLEVYKAHIAEWRQRYPKLTGVDLRYDGEVPLEMATDGSASPSVHAQTTSATAAAAINQENAKPSAAPAASGKSAAARKAEEAKKRTARLRAEKLKAAREKAAHNASHPPIKQGQ